MRAMPQSTDHPGRFLIPLLLAVLVAPPLARAGLRDLPPPHLGKWSAIAELGYTRDRQHSRVRGGVSSDFNRDEYREKIHLRNQGSYWLDPRLGTANLEGSVELFQEQDRFGQDTGTQRGNLKSYAADMSILPIKPLNGILRASRDENRVVRDFGATTDVATRTEGVRINLHDGPLLHRHGIFYFHSSLAANQRHTRERTEGFNQFFQRNERHRTVQYDAHRGYQTADLVFNYRYDDVQDNIRTRGGFTTHFANLDYSLDFGPTLNRRWHSNINYFDRGGEVTNRSFTADEDLLVHHNRDLLSDYRYFVNRFDTSGGVTTTQTLSALVNRTWYRNLTLGANAQGTRVDLPTGNTRNHLLGGSLSYRRQLPGHGQLSSRATLSHQIDDNNLQSSVVDVVDEPHAAPALFAVGNDIPLANEFVDPATIRVVDVRGGSRQLVAEGIDYLVIQEGNRTRIRPLANSILILPGDPLEISYSYSVAPSIRYRTRNWSLGGGLSYPWLDLSANHDQSNEKLLSGRDGRFLENRSLSQVDLDLHHRWGRTLVGASAGYQREDSTRLKYNQRLFRQYASYETLRRFLISGSIDEQFTDFKLPLDRQRDDYSAQLTLTGILGNGWLFDGLARMRVLLDTEIEDERTQEVRLQARRRLGLLTLMGNVGWSRFTRGPSRTDDLRFQVRLVRRLF